MTTPNIVDTIATAVSRAEDPAYGRNGLNIVLATNRDAALESADEVTRRYTDNKASLSMLGVPVAVKDNIATLDTPTTCGSRILRGYMSPYEATAITRLREQGAVIVAKTNMDEFAMGSSTEHSAYGPTKNPVDPTRVPGGSSGGSAAAVAAGITPVALGSETGGSVRQPAAFCGVIGVKPTYGRVSRYGLVAFSSSVDQIGVFAKTVRDAETTLYVISGRDQYDATSADAPVPTGYAAIGVDTQRSVKGTDLRVDGTDQPLKGITIGRSKEYFPETLDAGVRERCDAAFDRLQSLGATVKDVSLPHTNLAIPTYYIITPAEASSNLARFDGVRYGPRWNGDGDVQSMYAATRSAGFGPEVKRRIMLGTYVLSHGYYDAYYKKAKAVLSLITDDFRRVFDSGVDVLFTPTTPTPAFALGAVTDPYEMYLSDIFTANANLAGIPAMSQPIGRVNGLPVGGQLIANYFAEPTMFHVARALEHALGEEAHR
jgi:aspartyl-tRNA(Asn)/glutamyl-tRNA(Gln) amidotransferase subunit A